MGNFEEDIIWDVTTPFGDHAVEIRNVPRSVVEKLRETFVKVQTVTESVYVVNDPPPDDPVTVTIIIKEELSERIMSIAAKLVSDISWEAKKIIENAAPARPAETVVSGLPAKADGASVLDLIRETPIQTMVYVLVPQLKPSQREDPAKVKENHDRKALIQRFVSELKNFTFRNGSFCSVNLGGGTKQSPTSLFIKFPINNLDLIVQLLKKFEAEYGKSFHNKFYFEFVPKGSKKEDGFDLAMKDKT